MLGEDHLHMVGHIEHASIAIVRGNVSNEDTSSTGHLIDSREIKTGIEGIRIDGGWRSKQM